MKNARKRVNLSTEKLVLSSMLGAIVAVLSYLGGFIKIGGFASMLPVIRAH